MAKVYVGGIPESTQEADLEDAFSRYGKLQAVWIARNPPGFAFITFQDQRDADDAIAAMDGRNGWKVENARPPRRDRFDGGGGGRGGYGGGGGGYGGGDRYGGGGGRGGGGGDRRCYQCGEAGHFARECPQGGGGGGGGDRYGGGGGGYRDDRGGDRGGGYRGSSDRYDRDYDRGDRGRGDDRRDDRRDRSPYEKRDRGSPRYDD